MTVSVRAGALHVIAGPMFSGKSEELLRRVRRAKLAGQRVAVVNHALDSRYGSGEITSHAGLTISAVSVGSVADLLAVVEGRELDLLAIDEAQFFGPDLVAAVEAILARGITVVVAGLCVTFDGGPFEPLPALMAVADEVVKLTAVCALCGRDAPFHQRLAHDDVGDARRPQPAHVGGSETYQARCRDHLGHPHTRPAPAADPLA